VYDKKLQDLNLKLAGERGSAAAAVQVRKYPYTFQNKTKNNNHEHRTKRTIVCTDI